MRSKRIPTEEQYHLIMECRQSGLTDHNHTAEQKKQFRLEKEKPILDAFWNWLEQQRPNKGARGESGELCPKSERHSDDLSGRRSL